MWIKIWIIHIVKNNYLYHLSYFLYYYRFLFLSLLVSFSILSINLSFLKSLVSFLLLSTWGLRVTVISSLIFEEKLLIPDINLPYDFAKSWSFSGPKSKKAITKITKSSKKLIPNIFFTFLIVFSYNK